MPVMMSARLHLKFGVHDIAKDTQSEFSTSMHQDYVMRLFADCLIALHIYVASRTTFDQCKLPSPTREFNFSKLKASKD